MNLPTEEQCLMYFAQFRIPQNIREHCLNVQKLALFLANKLKDSGVDVNVDFVSRLALLHDLFKTVVIEKLEPNKFYNFNYSDEEIKAWEMLRQKYPGMHECDVAHVFFKDEFPELALSLKRVSNTLNDEKLVEEKIVHYADWRTQNNNIVTISERMTDLQIRYNKPPEYWEGKKEHMEIMENEIFSSLTITPEQLPQEIQNEQRLL